MTIGEWLLYICLFAWVVLFFLRKEKTNRMTIVLGAVSCFMLILHLLLDGQRWQIMPGYILFLFLSWYTFRNWYRRKRDLLVSRTVRRSMVYGVFGSLYFLIAFIIPHIFPYFEVPSPSGTYPVGTTYYQSVDLTRNEFYTSDPKDHRTVFYQVWYPAQVSTKPNNAPYLPYLSEMKFGISKYLLDYLERVPTSSSLEVAVHPQQKNYPVLVFSHGLGLGVLGSNSYTRLAQELASRGYIVVGITHSFHSTVTLSTDGEGHFFDYQQVIPNITKSGELIFDQIVDLQTEDIHFVLNQLTQINQIDPKRNLQGKLDLTRLGVFGHSIGAISAVNAALTTKNENLRAVASLDGFPLNSIPKGKKLRQPFLYIGADPVHNGLTPEQLDRLGSYKVELMKKDDRDITIKGSVHNSFDDLFFFAPLLKYLAADKLNEEAFDITTDLLDRFFHDAFLLGKPD